MPTFTRHELMLLTAILARPNHTWRNMVRGSGMSLANATVARNALLEARVIKSERTPMTDGQNRVFYRDVLELTPSTYLLPLVGEIKAWLDGGQKTPWPGPPHPRPRKATEVRPPGAHTDPVERLLETLLRNPHVPWRRLRLLSGLRGEISLYARRELEERMCVHVDVVEHTGRDGRRYPRRTLLPNENNALVQELRKRYGLRAIAPIVFEIRKALADTPPSEGSPWGFEDIDTEPTLHAKERLRRES